MSDSPRQPLQQPLPVHRVGEVVHGEGPTLCSSCGETFDESELTVEPEGLHCEVCKVQRDAHLEVRSQLRGSVVLFSFLAVLGGIATAAPQHPLWFALSLVTLAGPFYVLAGLWVAVRGPNTYADAKLLERVGGLVTAYRVLGLLNALLWALASWVFYSPAFL